jgi:pimeloyl-ACP methyl ester carboxylesterase
LGRRFFLGQGYQSAGGFHVAVGTVNRSFGRHHIVFKGFAGDLSPKEQDVVFAVQQPASKSVFGDVGVNAAWRTKPSWYVVASEDNAINPELEKRMAKRANAKTTILKTSHVAMLSKPNEVLDVILDAATSVSK